LRDARVTGSRLEAVRYKQSFDRYIQEKGYAIKTLMAARCRTTSSRTWVAGWGLHPLESAALSRRTPNADTERRK